MRKILFSAIALVAFTATGMAGEKPKEDVKTVNPASSFEVANAIICFHNTETSMAGEIPKEEVKTVTTVNCFQVANALICLHDTEGFWDWVFTYFTIYSNCVESQKNSKIN
jgi:hypothetical protein